MTHQSDQLAPFYRIFMWTFLVAVVIFDVMTFYVGIYYYDSYMTDSLITFGIRSKGSTVFKTMIVVAVVSEPGIIMTVFTIFMSKPRDPAPLNGQNLAYFVVSFHTFAIAYMCRKFGYDNVRFVNADFHILTGFVLIAMFPVAREVRRHLATHSDKKIDEYFQRILMHSFGVIGECAGRGGGKGRVHTHSHHAH